MNKSIKASFYFISKNNILTFKLFHFQLVLGQQLGQQPVLVPNYQVQCLESLLLGYFSIGNMLNLQQLQSSSKLSQTESRLQCRGSKR